MAINTSIWGLPENWNTFDDDNIIAVIKQPSCIVGEYNYRTFFRLAENDKIDLNSDIDNSLCVSGMGAECPYSNVNYYTVKNGAVESDSQHRDLTNWFFFNTPQKSAYTDQNCVTYLYNDDHYGQYRNFENTLSDTSNGNRWITPFIDYDIKDFVLLLRVECSDSPTGSQHYYFLDEYITTYYNTYPYVFRIFARLYAKSGTTPLRRKYIYQGTIEGSHYCTTAICDSYETTLVQTNKRVYCNHISSQRGDNIPVWGSSIDKNYTYFPCSSYDENGLIGIVYGNTADFETTVQSGNLYVSHHVTDITAFAEKARRAAAAFGCYFTGDENTAEYGSLTDNKMYIGLLDSDLIAHGDYAQGTDTTRAIQNTWNTVRDSTYEPNVHHIDYDTTSHYGILSYYNFNKMYSITNDQVELLYRELTAAMSAKPASMSETDYSKGTFLTNDPIDCIISLRKYPIPSTTSSSSVHDIYFGGYQSALSAPYANNAETIRYEFTGTKAFVSKYGGGFLDKEGYTTAELFIPFCGTVKLPVNEFIDHTLSVKLIVDYLTGTCTAYIELDGIPRMTINGSIGVDVPVTGIQTNDLQNTINRNIANLKTAQITAGMTARSGASIATGSGSASSAIMSAVNMINPIAIANKMDSTEKALISRDLAEYNLYHTEIPFKTVSAGDALTSGFGEWRCRLSITRPVLSQNYLDDPSVYAKTIGYACLKTGKVSEFTGLTVGTIDLSGINCTDKEKAMIMQAFKSGVYL